jgi:hypothetical protein
MFTSSRLSRSQRFAGTITALITVWCLGCSAFDPLIALLSGRDAGTGMVCGADERPAGGAAMVVAGGSSANSVIAPVHEGRPSTVVCDCQSCCAPAPTALAAAPLPPPPPGVDVGTFLVPPSLAREPLLPPPQRVA